ncbi:phosphatidylinositol-specific phospholipase C [Lichenibacterium dinghuense]|uniref:phosphatidylinositol-specific phospholipase C n=1 Tax=Lichenibacterium dinghuense TaxID=2895977 RepID=UPI001F468085|nr:phosphatidylinositol-specific phospholipase C [Lichenibacterium sp. 6Y81]
MSSTSMTDWMSSIDKDTNVIDMSIPGTHDSGAYNITAFPSNWIKTQTLNLKQQLEAGIRFLDIRLGWDSAAKIMKVYHGEGRKATYCNLDFYAAGRDNTVLGICANFLRDHPGETILMSLKEELSSSDFDSNVRSIITNTTSLWYRKESFPTLGEAKGFIILIRRWNWPQHYDNFGIDMSPELWNKAKGNPKVFNNSMVQDDFDAKGNETGQSAKTAKWWSIQNTLQLALSKPLGSRFILNFLSATKWTKLLDPKDFAVGSNNDGMLFRTQNWLNSYKGRYRLGVIALDFVGASGTQDLIPLIVGRNAKPDWTLSDLPSPQDYTPSKVFSYQFLGSLVLFFRSADTGRIIWRISQDGSSWPPSAQIIDAALTDQSLNAVSFQGTLYLFWKNKNASTDTTKNTIHFSTLIDNGTITNSSNWTPPSLINSADTTSNSLCTIVHQRKLHIFFNANDQTGRILHTMSEDGSTWPPAKPIDALGPTTHSIVSTLFRGEVWIFWRGQDNLMHYGHSSDLDHWICGKVTGDPQLGSSMGVCVSDGLIYLFFRAPSSLSGGQYTKISYTSSSDGQMWSKASTLIDDVKTENGLDSIEFMRSGGKLVKYVFVVSEPSASDQPHYIKYVSDVSV